MKSGKFDNNNVAYYHTHNYSSLQRLAKPKKMHGVKRVIAFCIMTAILPASLIILPLYLRHSIYADVVYSIAESDIMEIRDGISSIFCQQHTLQMNTSFNAFQINHTPKTSSIRKHIRLKKSMSLPDDTLEYWGFYLLTNATVELKVCSRYDGSRILVVKGERNLKNCGLLEHNKNKVGAHLTHEHGKVLVTFESAAEIVDSAGSAKNGSREQKDIYTTKEEALNHGGEDLSNDDVDDVEQPILRKGKFHSHHPSNSIDNNLNKGAKNVNSSSNISGKNREKTEHEINKAILDDNSKETEQIHKISDSLKLDSNQVSETNSSQHRKRHEKSKHRRREKISNDDIQKEIRKKRDLIFDRAINHGGNAINYTDNHSESVSSFENSLMSCYDGQILLAQSFKPSPLCQSVKFLDSGLHMVTKHEVASDGYYYYIFYSDNDYEQNDIHAVFDIYKPTFQYSNMSDTKGCINSTNCSFPIPFWSYETVIVEVPTRDGIEHEEDDITYLISTCHPRMAIYIIFPITVLFLILTCAFL